jgi:hypothetical protein
MQNTHCTNTSLHASALLCSLLNFISQDQTFRSMMLHLLSACSQDDLTKAGARQKETAQELEDAQRELLSLGSKVLAKSAELENLQAETERLKGIVASREEVRPLRILVAYLSLFSPLPLVTSLVWWRILCWELDNAGDWF